MAEDQHFAAESARKSGTRCDMALSIPIAKWASFFVPLTLAIVLWVAMGRAGSFDPKSLQIVAEKGDPEAEFTLGQAYDTGKGVPPEPKKALEYYRRAAEHGNAKAQNNLASFYATGTGGVHKNDVEARKWLRKAAEQGAALAQDNLGLMLAQENDPEALKWFQRAAEQGLLSAQLHLGNIYYHGSNGVKRDYVQAFTWLQKAAEQNNPWAQNILGVMYQNGQGGKSDPALAMLWFERAAEQGNAKAQSNLGQMYCLGKGVVSNAVEGYKWLTLSVEQGEVTAQKFLPEVEAGMTPGQIATGKALVEEYKRKLATSPAPGKQ